MHIQDYEKVQIQSEVSEVRQTTPSTEVQQPNSVHGSGYAEGEQGDAYVVNQQEQHKTVQKRSETELINSIEALCTEYGICKNNEEKLQLLERVSGLSRKKLQCVSQKELKQIIDCLKMALQDAPKTNNQLDLEKVKELANDYNIALHTGWTLEGFKEAQKNGKQESFMTRLDRVYPKYKGDVEKQLEAYFNDFFEAKVAKRIQNAKTPEEVEKIKQDVKKEQLQDIGRLLANSSDEEVAIFKAAVKHLYAENRCKALNAILESLDTEELRSAFADGCDANYVQELAQTPDRFGDYSSTEEISQVTASVAQHQTETGRMEFHQGAHKNATEFFTEHKEELEAIDKKIENGEELTPEEEALKRKADLYTAISAGEIVGTENSVVLNEEQIDKIMSTLNQDAYGLPNYRDILNQVKDFISKHPEILTMTIKEFIEKLDEDTNGNYSIVINDNGNESSLNPPDNSSDDNVADAPVETSNSAVTQNSEQATAPVSSGLGFTQKPAPLTLNNTTTVTEVVNNQVDSVDEVLSAIKNGDNTVVREYLSSTGSKGIIEILSDSRFGIWWKNVALNMFKNMDNKAQVEVLSRPQSNQVVSYLLPVADNSAVMELDSSDFLNAWAEKRVESAQKQIRKLNHEYA